MEPSWCCNRTPEFLYEKVYCARGRSEGFIKNHKTYLQSDRTSAPILGPTNFASSLHSAAYVLLHTIQQIACAALNGRSNFAVTPGPPAR